MRIKRFTAPTSRDAMKSVKAEFGEEALILSTKRLSGGNCEVVAAIDYDLSRPLTLSLSCPGGEGGPDPAASGPGGSRQGKEDLPQALKKELEELKELKDLCMSFVARTSPYGELFTALEEKMAGNGIDRRLARKILTSTLSNVAGDKANDADYIKSSIKKRVFEKIEVLDPLSKKGAVAFVGPSGVGKTTTIAKLAAIEALRKRRKVALLTMDTYRIAAAEQLKVYGKLIGVPVEVAGGPDELKGCIERHGDKDLILVDTAGSGPRENARMEGLSQVASACPEVRFNLVLSSQTRDASLYDSIKGFSSLPIGSLTFTRLDEGAAHGAVLNATMLSKKPVAYLSSGQRVPEDIEAATKERLVNFLLPN